MQQNNNNEREGGKGLRMTTDPPGTDRQADLTHTQTHTRRAHWVLLRFGEFQRVADDLDSLLLRTGSVCRGRFTVDEEHLPAPERTGENTHTHTRSQRNRQGNLHATRMTCRIVGDGRSTEGNDFRSGVM